MSNQDQLTERIAQALAADARTAGTTVDRLGLWHCYDVGLEIAELYPWATEFDAANAVTNIRHEARRAAAWTLT